MQFILIASGVPEQPICQAVVPLKDIVTKPALSKGGKKEKIEKLKFSQLVGITDAPDFKKCELDLEIGYDIVLEK